MTPRGSFDHPQLEGTMPRRQILVLSVLGGLAGLVFLTTLSSGFLVDLWWFREIGYSVVFSREIIARLLLFAAGFVVTLVLVRTNLAIAQRGVVPLPVTISASAPGGATTAIDVTTALARVTRPLSVVLAVFAGMAASSSWSTVLRAMHGTPFGTVDPVFGRDIGFYVFSLPAVTLVLGMLTSLATLLLLLLVAMYASRGDIVLRPQRVTIEPSAGMHLGVVLAAWFVLAALRLWLVDTPNLLYSTTGPLVGASYTDLHARLPAIRLSAVAALLAAVWIVVGGARQRVAWHAFVAVGAYAAIGVLGRGVFPAVMQRFVVAPTELTREAPQLAHHIAATRRAWGLDSVEVRDLGGEANLSLADLRANAPTIENVRLWDRDPLLRTFGQLQEIRTYYDFVAVDDDRYWIDGKLRQVLLSPRELNPSSLPTRTFINEHLTFTHGMGLTLSPVNQVTPQGLPVLFVKDLPPAAVGNLRVTRPQIYYGELADQFVFVKTKQREFDYPAGEVNEYTSYDGRGGVPVGNLFRRLILALHFGSSNVLLSGDITNESRVLYHRRVVSRIRKALPFLRLDRDPYLVIAADGTLQWIQDAYTATDRYPYAWRSPEGVTYMRNSVKVVVDAYDGTIAAYVSDPNDPIIQTWDKVFPGTLLPLDRLSADLRSHLRYPDELYRAQSTLFTTYHMDKPEDFYHREDQWQIPVVERADGSVPFMRHIVMRLPDEDSAEYIYMVPFTPRGKDNLAAWMVARNDGANYGKLRVYRFPRQSLVFGPRQVENRINQDTEISRQVSLWDQRGSQVIRGDLLVIPINEALLYVQPLYLEAEGGRIPELKRVVVAFQDQVVMRETLEAALADLFGGSSAGPASPQVATGTPPQATSAEATNVQAQLAEARRRYQAALAAQREGDWARYGEEIRRLGELLERLGTAAPRPPQ
ncbi:MAG: UPF0182 family protein [Gemmatimonadetes bacterium]|nr:UPF0182 family protein [Gemmatimonadota bacterium]